MTRENGIEGPATGLNSRVGRISWRCGAWWYRVADQRSVPNDVQERLLGGRRDVERSASAAGDVAALLGSVVCVYAMD